MMILKGDIRWLIDEFMARATELCKEECISPGELMNMKLKKRRAASARKRLVRCMRKNYIQSRISPHVFRKRNEVEDDRSMFIGLSTTVTAWLFGGNHSTICLIEKRDKEGGTEGDQCKYEDEKDPGAECEVCGRRIEYPDCLCNSCRHRDEVENGLGYRRELQEI